MDFKVDDVSSVEESDDEILRGEKGDAFKELIKEYNVKKFSELVDIFQKIKSELVGAKQEEHIAKEKYNDLTSKLRKEVECPVCLEVPISGPIPVCANGHVICSICKGDHCPTCRGRMIGANSLLAAKVIEIIEHECKIEECTQLVPLSELESHTKTCQYRLVSCPAPTELCDKVMAHGRLSDHNMTECEGSRNKDNNLQDFRMMPVTVKVPRKIDSAIPGAAFMWNDSFFYINREMADGYTVFSIQYLGNEDECKNFEVDLAVHDITNYDVTGRFVQGVIGEPLPLNMEENQRKKNGLMVGDFFLDRIAICENDLWKIGITFNIKK